jgi:phage tail sheath gpL-like
MSSIDGSITSGSSGKQGFLTVTVTFSEPVTGFSTSDLTVTPSSGVTVGNLTNSANTIYTMTVTLTADGIYSFSIGANAVTDSVGSGNGATSVFVHTAGKSSKF